MNDRQVANHIASLRHKDPNIRRHAANALGEIGDPSTVPALIGSLNDRTDFVRRKAAISLKKIGAPAVPALAGALKSREELVRNAAYEALMAFGDASALPAVIEALKDDNVFVRGYAVEVLGKLGDASAVPALIVVMRDRYDAMWRAKYAPTEKEQIVAALESATYLEAALSRPMRPTEYHHNRVRSDAAEILGKIGDASAIPALIEALQDEEPSVRGCAADALGRIGDVAAVPALIEAWNARDRWERRPSHDALWSMGDDVTLPRKILAETRFSPQERIDMLEKLRRVRGEGSDLIGNTTARHYQFPETAALCEEVLWEEDADARKGAQSVLNWLTGERHLLHASQADEEKESRELVRAAEGSDWTAGLETLLRAAEPSEQPAKTPQPPPALWQRLFGKHKGAAS
jgi:HEAT repeat protein